MHEDGRLELEYFDFSAEANDHFGNDIAWIYRIEPSAKLRLYEPLSVGDDEAMLNAFVQKFGDAKQVRDWLREMQIPFEEEFDSWA